MSQNCPHIHFLDMYTCWLMSCVPLNKHCVDTPVRLTYGESCMKVPTYFSSSTRWLSTPKQGTLPFQPNCTQAFYKQQKGSPLQYVVTCKLWGICVLVRDFFICDHVWSCGVSSWGFLIDCKHLSGNCLLYKRLKALSLSFNWNLVWF